MYAVIRTYKGLSRERREAVADDLGRELKPDAQEGGGLQAFGVDDKGEVIVSTTVYEDAAVAKRASLRPPVRPELKPEVTVREIGLDVPEMEAGTA